MSDAANPMGPESLPNPRPFAMPFASHWKTSIQQSGLPKDVQALISSVVVGSRLLRFEKTEIATELISHFQDGDLSGQSYDQLMDDFGDPAITASLIRRSKLRNRPMFMKILQGLGIGAGLMTATYLAVLAFFHLGQPNPNTDYVVELNSEIADIDDSQKAWLLYRPVWTKYGFSEGGDCRFEDLFTRDEAATTHRLAKPTDADWPQAVAELAKHEELLDVFRAGAKLPSLGLELESDVTKYSDEDFAALFPGRDKTDFSSGWLQDEDAEDILHGSLISIMLPHVQSFRKAGRAFHVDTRLAVEQGDSDRAVENIVTVFGLANQAAETPYLVCGLVGMSVAGLGFEQLEEVMTDDPDFFSEAQLARMQKSIQQMPVRSWLDFEGERASIKDIIQRCYTDDGNGDGRMTSQGVELLSTAETWMTSSPSADSQDDNYEAVAYAARKFMAPASLFMCASRKEVSDKTDELIDRCIADAQVPFWLNDELDGFQRETDKFFEENKTRHVLLAMMFPASQQVINALDRTIARQEGVIAALAIHRYYQTYGDWPTEYDQVSPEFATEFPQDQLDGSLLKFTYRDDQLRVYSVGRDHEDDGGIDHGRKTGGKLVPEARSHFIFGAKSDDYDGDWILWPQLGDAE